MEKNGELIQEFCAITACRPEEASFHLESCNWNLDSALHSFFENSELAADRVLEPRRLEDQEQEEEVEVAEVAAPGNPNPPLMASESKSKRNKKPSTSRAAGITTLSDIQRGAASSGSDSDSDGPQEYYTGGEKSGMLVQDPSRRGGPDVNDIFERARQLGATEEPPPEEDRSSRPRAFTGTARLLSGETVPTAPEPQVPQTVSHTITFWRNGFTVDDGPLRTLDDPANASFLESIGRHQCPQELQPSDFRTQVEIRLARRMDEDCVVQTPKLVPFQGVGRTLGSSSSCAAAEPSSSTSIVATSSVSSKEFSVDDSKPVTSVQVRLADGTRMVARFNHHHTVADIQAFINAARPGGASHYQLQAMGFPPRLLNDPAETIEKAGLLNSVVIQKL